MANGSVKAFDGDLEDYSQLIVGGGPTSARAPKSPPAAEKKEAPKPKRELGPLRKEIVAVEQKMQKFQDLLRRVDEMLATASQNSGNSPQVVDLTVKRAELERALMQTEETWLELSARAESIDT